MRKWRVEDSRELYNVQGWGLHYFSINEKGHATVRPNREEGPEIDLKEIVDDLCLRDVGLPVLLRFPDILGERIKKISTCFKLAAQEYGFTGSYYNVYPIKVNQQRPVLEEIVSQGKQFNIGLEAGSKPELHAVLAIQDNPEALIICNGYKDEDFIELALLAQKMGKRIYIVVEKLNELHLVRELAERLKVRPNIGIRIKLASSGSGKWEDSGGDQSKFGLNPSELLEAVDLARQFDLLDCVKLVHFHLGSQITNIRKIKSGLREVAQFFVEMHKLGCAIQFVDVGGGLGVDYDGTRSLSASSINYTIQEYANDVIYMITEAANKYEIPHPNIIAESGRALTAHHSILVFNVLETTSPPDWEKYDYEVNEETHKSVRELYHIYSHISQKNSAEAWHDAVQLREEVLDRFSLGMVDLETRALAERLYWSIARKAAQIASKMKQPPLELETLTQMLAKKYFCNFSLFQSLPDSWAIDQIFPIIPLHRHSERPTVEGTLQDITCDSDGKINHFIGLRDYSNVLPLHEFKKEEPYYIGVYLVGAYQEILGDLHNLFGDTNQVHIVCEDKAYRITQIIEGETVADVLDYVQFNAKKLVRNMETWVGNSVKDGKISVQEGREFLNIYRSGLFGYTYLE